MKKFVKPVAWSLPSVVLLVATYFVIKHIVDTFPDPTLRWTAIGAVLAGAALLVAAIGLPLALYQLVALDRDLGRPKELRDRLIQYRRSGQIIRSHLLQWEGEKWHDDRKHWIEDLARFLIAELGDDEADDFRHTGGSFGPTDELDAKFQYIRDDLLPKVIAGYW